MSKFQLYNRWRGEFFLRCFTEDIPVQKKEALS
jgi:hypothetical protein